MSKAPSPLLGFNNNVRHKGRVFHVQTEDSGVRHPHVITHLFMDGGRILKTTKTSYAEHLGSENMGEVVRKMMKEQHKAMFVALREGLFDEVIAKGSSTQMPALSSGSQLVAPRVLPSSGSLVAAAPVSVPLSDGAISTRLPAAPAAIPSEPSVAVGSPAIRSSELPAAPVPAPASKFEGFYREVGEEPRPRSTFPAASNASLPPARSSFAPTEQSGSQRPPAVANLGDSGRFAPVEQSRSQHPPAAAKLGDSGRYAASRPSSPFASSRPTDGQSIFGEEMISEKSLDEVILSYLAEDLDSTPEK